MGNKKVGRPTDNPKTHRITVRLDDGTYLKLNKCSEKSDISFSEVVREGIDNIYDQYLGRDNIKKE